MVSATGDSIEVFICGFALQHDPGAPARGQPARNRMPIVPTLDSPDSKTPAGVNPGTPVICESALFGGFGSLFCFREHWEHVRPTVTSDSIFAQCTQFLGRVIWLLDTLLDPLQEGSARRTGNQIYAS